MLPNESSTAAPPFPLIVRAQAGLIRAGYLPQCARGDPTYHWKPRSTEVNRRAWQIVLACGKDPDLIDLVLAFLGAGNLPRWLDDWDGWLARTVKDARHMLELSKCEDCGVRKVKAANGVPLDPDPLAAVRERLSAEGKLGPKANGEANGTDDTQ